MPVVPSKERIAPNKALPNVGVVPSMFFGYRTFVEQLHEGFDERNFSVENSLYVDESMFKNGERWLKVNIGDKGWEDDLLAAPRSRAIIPIWTSNKFGGDEAYVKRTVARMIEAVTHTERGRLPLVEEALGVAPFIDLRQDKDGKGGGKGKREVGEACEAVLIARDLIGLNKFAILGTHSSEGLDYIKQTVPDVLPITATPLFAEHIKTELFDKKVIDPKNARVVSLDKGSLQQCLLLSEQLGLDPAENIISFDKDRKGHNMVGSLMLQYGDPNDMEGKDMIIYDDIIDTYGSMKETCQQLKDKYHCKSITVIATHGVLSNPGRGNALTSLDTNGHGPVVDNLIMSDSLPTPKYAFKGTAKVTIIPVARMLGNMTKAFTTMTWEEMYKDDRFKSYILDPVDKEIVWERFQQEQALPDRVHLPIDQSAS